MANNRWRICGRVKKFTWSYKQSKQRSTWKSELENRWSGFKFMWYTNGSLRGHILQKQMILYLHIWLFTSSPSHANTQKHTLRGWMREEKDVIHTQDCEIMNSTIRSIIRMYLKWSTKWKITQETNPNKWKWI